MGRGGELGHSKEAGFLWVVGFNSVLRLGIGSWDIFFVCYCSVLY